jgi:hypothetical protein
MDFKKQQKNEKQFNNWTETSTGGRIYWYEIPGKHGWKARYVKEVNSNEDTLTFRQEIYDENDVLVEIHQKFPVDTGHQKIS